MTAVKELRDLIELHAVVDPFFDQNCYVLRRRDTDRCLVVDPGFQGEAVLHLLEGESLGCDRILVSHGHPDHVAGVAALKAAHACPVAIHPADHFLLADTGFLPRLPGDLPQVEVDEELAEGQVIHWRELEIAVLHTPGHTPGSVCFLIGPDLLSGDTLFHHSIGRTDLPGGSLDALLFSIQNRLYALPPETVVHPGHGPGTSLGEEMRSNPFVLHPRFR